MSVLDLPGKRGLVVGIANENSIAYGGAKAFHAAGAELAITYLNATAEPYVRPVAEKLASPIIVPCDVRTNASCSLPHETCGPRRRSGTRSSRLLDYGRANIQALEMRARHTGRAAPATKTDAGSTSTAAVPPVGTSEPGALGTSRRRG